MAISSLMIAFIAINLMISTEAISGNVYEGEVGISHNWMSANLWLLSWKVRLTVDPNGNPLGEITGPDLNGWFIVYDGTSVLLKFTEYRNVNLPTAKYWLYELTLGYQVFDDTPGVGYDIKFCRNAYCDDETHPSYIFVNAVESITPNPYQFVGIEDISCNDIKDGSRNLINGNEDEMPLYRFEANANHNYVYLEGCASSHDIWLYLFDVNGQLIYDEDDQFNWCHIGGVANAQACNNQYAGDITVTDAANKPNAISISAGQVFYFGIGAYNSAVGDYEVELFCDNTCASSSAKVDGISTYKFYDPKNETPSFTISVNSFFMMGGIILILLLVINILCVTYKNCCASNGTDRRYSVVKTIDSESEYA